MFYVFCTCELNYTVSSWLRIRICDKWSRKCGLEGLSFWKFYISAPARFFDISMNFSDYEIAEIIFQLRVIEEMLKTTKRSLLIKLLTVLLMSDWLAPRKSVIKLIFNHFTRRLKLRRKLRVNYVCFLFLLFHYICAFAIT